MEGASTNTGTASGTRVTAGTEAYLSQINTFPAPPGDIPTGGGGASSSHIPGFRGSGEADSAVLKCVPTALQAGSTASLVSSIKCTHCESALRPLCTRTHERGEKG